MLDVQDSGTLRLAYFQIAITEKA